MDRTHDTTDSLHRLLAATLPAHGIMTTADDDDERCMPGLGELDLQPFWERFDQTAPASLKFGLRAAVTALSLAVPLLVGRVATLKRLSDDELETLVTKAHESRVFALRQMAETLKIVACLAYFHDEGIQRRVRGAQGFSTLSAHGIHSETREDTR